MSAGHRLHLSPAERHHSPASLFDDVISSSPAFTCLCLQIVPRDHKYTILILCCLESKQSFASCMTPRCPLVRVGLVICVDLGRASDSEAEQFFIKSKENISDGSVCTTGHVWCYILIVWVVTRVSYQKTKINSTLSKNNTHL